MNMIQILANVLVFETYIYYAQMIKVNNRLVNEGCFESLMYYPGPHLPPGLPPRSRSCHFQGGFRQAMIFVVLLEKLKPPKNLKFGYFRNFYKKR